MTQTKCRKSVEIPGSSKQTKNRRPQRKKPTNAVPEIPVIARGKANEHTRPGADATKGASARQKSRKARTHHHGRASPARRVSERQEAEQCKCADGRDFKSRAPALRVFPAPGRFTPFARAPDAFVPRPRVSDAGRFVRLPLLLARERCAPSCEDFASKESTDQGRGSGVFRFSWATGFECEFLVWGFLLAWLWAAIAWFSRLAKKIARERHCSVILEK